MLKTKLWKSEILNGSMELAVGGGAEEGNFMKLG